MAHEQYKEMLPAHALFALDADEARVLNQHLSECAECRSELADWESTAAALALTTSPAEPAPQTRERIMGAIKHDNSSQQGARVVSFPQRRANVWSSFGSVGAIAAVVLFVVLIIWIVVLWQQNRAMQTELEVLSNQVRSVQEEVNRSDEFVKLLSTPGAKLTQLDGSGPGTGASARLAYDRSGRAMLMVRDLYSAPAGKAYQLWFIVGNKPPIPGKTFSTDDMGRAALTDQVPEQARESAVFAVTLEPAGGVSAPTGAIYLRGGL